MTREKVDALRDKLRRWEGNLSANLEHYATEDYADTTRARVRAQLDIVRTIAADLDEATAEPIGTCPACGETVYDNEPDGPVWTCPADLSETNPYRETPNEAITEELRESCGVFSNCGEDYGFPCYDPMPLHSACYDGGAY